MTHPNKTPVLYPRRYDLDWLRIIAFSLLIFYHTARFYNLEPWHGKSLYMSDFLQPLMNIMSPWRLSLLFIISGVAMRFVADKSPNLLATAWGRFKFLFLPLLFGMLIVVAPQTYIELLTQRGLIEPGYWAFYADYLALEQKWAAVFTPTYNHLWYVLYLLIYTLLYLAIYPIMKKLSLPNWGRQMLNSPLMLLLPALPFILYRFTTDIWWPQTNDITTGDFGANIRYGSYFLLGTLIAKSDAYWGAVKRYWKLAAIFTAFSAMVMTPYWSHWDLLAGQDTIMTLLRIGRVFYIWWMIVALMGLAQTYLNKPSPKLTYLTEAIFPYYILHQTLIILIGYWLTPYAIGPVAEFCVVFLGTIGGCVTIHEYLIRRITLLRPLFGLKI